MLRVNTESATTGMKLAISVYHPTHPDHILLRYGYELQPNDLARLRQMRVHGLWVRYPSFDFLSKFVDERVLVAQQPVLQQMAQTFETLQNQSTARLPYENYCESIGRLIQSLAYNPSAAIFMGDLTDCDDELLRHSTAVMYLSVLMGLKLSDHLIKQRRHIDPARAREVNNLGIGAMLHDVGVARLEDSVRDRYGATGDDTDPSWREHPSLGYEMVHGKIDPSAATVVLHHHQRRDGSGYAGSGWPALSGRRIHVFAQITALADQFDRMCHPVNRPRQPTVCVLRGLLAEPVCDNFEPQILKALCLVAPPYPPGSVVRLTNDQWAVVVNHNGADPCHPVVQTVPGPPQAFGAGDVAPGPELDLSRNDGALHIAENDGWDVSELNFAAPPLLQGSGGAMAYL